MWCVSCAAIAACGSSYKRMHFNIEMSDPGKQRKAPLSLESGAFSLPAN
jgi:hypothetical protein